MVIPVGCRWTAIRRCPYGEASAIGGANQRRSAVSKPSVLFGSATQAMQASGRISLEGPLSTATQRTRCVVAATSLEAVPLGPGVQKHGPAVLHEIVE